jgi:hypothetical protein
MFENREFRRIFGLLVEEVRSGWRKRRNKALNNFYFSAHTIWMINSRTKYETHMARLRREMRTKVWYEILKERDHLDDLDVNGRIILKLILNKCNGRA